MDFAEPTIRTDAAHGSPSVTHGRHFRAGLHYHEVESLMDWLEARGVSQRELQIEIDGTFCVKWQE